MKIDELLRIVIAALEDLKAQNIVVLEAGGITSLFDYMIIASGTSTRQTKALAHHVQEKVKAAGGKVYSIEGEQAGEWLLVDLGDIVAHIMQPTIREYYDLESLWAESSAVKKKKL